MTDAASTRTTSATTPAGAQTLGLASKLWKRNPSPQRPSVTRASVTVPRETELSPCHAIADRVHLYHRADFSIVQAFSIAIISPFL